jgi:hypothetical protein
MASLMPAQLWLYEVGQAPLLSALCSSRLREPWMLMHGQSQ